MKTNRRSFLVLAGSTALPRVTFGAPGAAVSASAERYFVYIGTYTRGVSKGIYASRMDAASGAITSPRLVAETPNPSFLALHPGRKFLYAVSEIAEYDGKKSGAVSAFSLEPQTGSLTLLNTAASLGAGPCHLSVDSAGRNLLVANYGSGSVAVLPLKEDGSLGDASAFVQHSGSSVNPSRQQGPHAHSINLSPDNLFAIVADLGLDRVFVYRFDSVKGTLARNEPPFTGVNPGAGPRHFAFHPGGRFGYVINELQSSVTAFAYDAARGALTELQTISTLPQGFAGSNSTAEVQVHPAGKFLYGSNRGHNSIAVFAIDAAKGTLEAIEHVSTRGETPRNFGIDPSGSHLLAANQKSGGVVAFRIDRQTGRLTPSGQVLEVDSPVCVKFIAVQ